jgi:hypothetical protein
MVAANIGHLAVLQGHTALFTTARQMLSERAALDSDSALGRRLQQDAAPDLRLIDEVGKLSCSNRGDMLFDLVSRRCLQKITLMTTIRRMGRGLRQRDLGRLARRQADASCRTRAYR